MNLGSKDNSSGFAAIEHDHAIVSVDVVPLVVEDALHLNLALEVGDNPTQVTSIAELRQWLITLGHPCAANANVIA